MIDLIGGRICACYKLHCGKIDWLLLDIADALCLSICSLLRAIVAIITLNNSQICGGDSDLVPVHSDLYLNPWVGDRRLLVRQ